MIEEEFLTLTEARELLGISKTTLAKLVREGTLPARLSKLDKRVKLVRRADVGALMGEARRSHRKQGKQEL